MSDKLLREMCDLVYKVMCEKLYNEVYKVMGLLLRGIRGVEAQLKCGCTCSPESFIWAEPLSNVYFVMFIFIKVHNQPATLGQVSS